MSTEKPAAVISCYGCYRNSDYGIKNPIELPISSLASKEKFYCPNLRKDGLCYAFRGMGIRLTALDLLTSPLAHLLNILQPGGMREFTVEEDWLLSKPAPKPCEIIQSMGNLVKRNSWILTKQQ